MFFRMVYKSGQIFLLFCHNPRVCQTDRQTDGRTEISSQSAHLCCVTIRTNSMHAECTKILLKFWKMNLSTHCFWATVIHPRRTHPFPQHSTTQHQYINWLSVILLTTCANKQKLCIVTDASNYLNTASHSSKHTAMCARWPYYLQGTSRDHCSCSAWCVQALQGSRLRVTWPPAICLHLPAWLCPCLASCCQTKHNGICYIILYQWVVTNLINNQRYGNIYN